MQAGASACAAVAAAIAIMALLGWNLGYETLMAIEPGFIPVQYNTAIAFLCCSLSLLVLSEGGRRWLATVAATSALLLAAATATEYLFGADLGIDTLFFKGLVADHVAGRMAPNTVVAFLCISSALLLLAWRSRAGGAIGIAVSLAAFVAAVGSVALTGYIAAIPSVYQWHSHIPIAVLTTIAFLALAAGTILSAWRSWSEQRQSSAIWLPAPIFVFLMSVCLMIASALWNMSRTAVLPEIRRSLVFSMVLVLLFGGVVSAALVAVIRLAQIARARTECLEDANRSLDAEIEHRREQQARTEKLNRALRMISACNQAIAKACDEDDLLRGICRIAIEEGGYRLAWVGFALDDAAKTLSVVAKAGEAEDYVSDGFVTWADEPLGRGPTGTAIRNRHFVVCHDIATDETLLPWRERAARFGLRSSMVIPLVWEGRAFGALSLYSAESSAFQEEEQALFQRLVGDLTFGIESVRTRQARERAEERLRLLAAMVDSSDDAIYAKTLDGKILTWNGGAERLYGYSGEEVVGKDINLLVPPDRRHDLCELFRRLKSGENVDHYETARRRKDGSIVEVSLSLSLVRGEDGAVLGACSIARDISERKRAESELLRFTQELKRSNEELQEFAFVASHDLQEPLRKITAFSERLRERSAGQLDPVNLDFLNRMHNAATRMSGLIESLLEYSRVATRGLPFVEVDLAQTMLGVLVDLEQRIRESHAEVVVGRLPKVYGDPTQLRQLLQNLVANALKFHAPDTPPRVAIRSCPKDGRWEITVSDAGIGFAPEYAEKIFRPFQRLHGRTEYEGSGMGLAICRKIAQRHGSPIGVHSQPGKGSVFTVSLPALNERTEPCLEHPSVSCSPRMMTTTTC